MVKTCSVCCESKALDEFYVGSAKCKPCYRLAVRVHRATNLERVRAYDRARAKLPHRIANATRVTREWRRAHRDRLKAHNKAARTRMEKPETCEGCGLSKRLEKHHPDYAQPLLVVWLCKPCHAIADKIRRKTEKATA